MLKSGTLYYKGNHWFITDAPPHVAIKLKAIFSHIPKSAVNPFQFPDTPEFCSDLLWFTGRYEMEIDHQDKKRLLKEHRKYLGAQADMGALLMPDYKPSAHNFKDGIKERDYQAIGRELWMKVQRMVCGDDLGLGKTTIALGGFLNKETLPALVVVQTHLPKQWHDRIEAFTDLTVHCIKGTKPYDLPPADVYIIKYSCISGWVNYLSSGMLNSIVFDEVQELRVEKSEKYKASKAIASCVKYALGLTATLIYNYGNEAFNIFDAIKPGALGTRDDFAREWCGYGKAIKDPAAFGSYLRSQFHFLRRTRTDVGRELPPVNKIVHEVEVDGAEVRKSEELALQLSMKVLGGNFMEAGQASRELDLLVRHSTGISKAREVASYAKLFLENNEPIILVGWHRDVYDIWLEELAAYNPAMFTGSESGTQKEAAKAAFLSGGTNLLIMSLRSGPGTDGLQARCKVMIIGELDWSPGVHNQLIGRIDRDGQPGNVMVVFVVCNQGSDPTMMRILGLKSSQAAHINDPDFHMGQTFSDESRIKELARSYIEKHSFVESSTMTA